MVIIAAHIQTRSSPSSVAAPSQRPTRDDVATRTAPPSGSRLALPRGGHPPRQSAPNTRRRTSAQVCPWAAHDPGLDRFRDSNIL
ncbi:hypothetical protein CBOM_05246 [Ceraceosorus bombacis]|uniref:Uncharacterized protein n=1 Tax=Ceraceosorus bombacis TaxID=401625 RepID=A0A0P1BRQ4_9BASI|nr:hypothetical protein CBOM_05246 [Ceraceosorus bombacis]